MFRAIWTSNFHFLLIMLQAGSTETTFRSVANIRCHWGYSLATECQVFGDRIHRFHKRCARTKSSISPRIMSFMQCPSHHKILHVLATWSESLVGIRQETKKLLSIKSRTCFFWHVVPSKYKAQVSWLSFGNEVAGVISKMKWKWGYVVC